MGRENGKYLLCALCETNEWDVRVCNECFESLTQLRDKPSCGDSCNCSYVRIGDKQERLSNITYTVTNTPLTVSTLSMDQSKRELLKKGSDHYKNGDIEPIDYLFANDLGEDFCLGSIIKYATRWRYRGRKKEELEKIIHYAEFLLERVEDGSTE